MLAIEVYVEGAFEDKGLDFGNRRSGNWSNVFQSAIKT
jgi:hypothetical protein